LLPAGARDALIGVAFAEMRPELLALAVAAISVTPLLVALALQYLANTRSRGIASAQLSRDREWGVLRRQEILRAPSLDELASWAITGRLLASDSVYNPITGGWARASSYPVLAEGIKQNSEPPNGASKAGDSNATVRQRHERIVSVAMAAMLIVAAAIVLVHSAPMISSLVRRLRANARSTNAAKPDAEAVLRIKTQCRAEGAKMRERWVRQYHGETFSAEPEYGYSEQLQTCLYSDSYSDVGAGLLPGVIAREDRFVVDVYADKVVLELTLHDGNVVVPATHDSIMCESEPEFVERKFRLFGSRGSAETPPVPSSVDAQMKWLDAKIRCTRQGREWLAELTKEHEHLGERVSSGQFAYNNSLNTCMCYYYVSWRGTVTSQVTDILSNQVILSRMTQGAVVSGPTIIVRDTRPGAAPIRDGDDFDARVRALGF